MMKAYLVLIIITMTRQRVTCENNVNVTTTETSDIIDFTETTTEFEDYSNRESTSANITEMNGTSTALYDFWDETGL